MPPVVQLVGRVGVTPTFLAVAVSGVTAVGAIRTISPVGAVAVSPVRTIRYTSLAYMIAT